MRELPSTDVNDTSAQPANLWLARYAKLVVAMTFVLIFIGGHTTTSGAGMAFADWPLSSGSVNPDGWWVDMMQRLEHGHRLTAETVGLLVGILCAWVWGSKWSVPVSFGISIVLAVGAKVMGASSSVVAHVGLWSSAAIFTILILLRARRDDLRCSAPVRWLAFAAFLGVCGQAVLGGLRVIHDPAGILAGEQATANLFRVIHGCFAQVELCLLVAIAAMLSPVWREVPRITGLSGVRALGLITVAFVFLQLIAGATMRHLNAGLAIPTYPRMPDGGWVPKVHNALIDLNFTHTRVGAVLVTLLIVSLVWRTFTRARESAALVRPAAFLLALVVVQFTLGIFVIWKLRPPFLTTLHVVNGAAVLATTVLLAVRTSRAASLAQRSETKSSVTARGLMEATA